MPRIPGNRSLHPRCHKCNQSIPSMVDVVSCLACGAHAHRDCVGLGAGHWIGLPTCPACPEYHEVSAVVLDTMARAGATHLAASTIHSYRRQLRKVESTLVDSLGYSWPTLFPQTWGDAQTAALASFVTLCLREGVARDTVLGECGRWFEALRWLGCQVAADPRVKLFLDRLAPPHKSGPRNVKDPLPLATVCELLASLMKEASQPIAQGQELRPVLAVRDIIMIVCGFFHLLWRSELVGLRLMDFFGDTEPPTILVQRSKTD